MSITFEHRIVIDGSSLPGGGRKAFEARVLNELYRVAETKTGLCVFHELKCSTHVITILPSGSVTSTNAVAIPTNRADATYRWHPVLPNDSRAASKPYGTGIGSDVTIDHNPFAGSVADNASTLLHELTHAAEDADGKLVATPIGWDFDTQAEFDAILVQNIYNSEAGLPLRGDHDFNLVLTSPLMVPKPDFIRLLQSFRNRMPRLAQHLGDVHAPYNPLRKGAVGYVGVQGDIPGSKRHT